MFQRIKTSQVKIPIMENTAKIKRSRRPKIDPDDALRIGVSVGEKSDPF